MKNNIKSLIREFDIEDRIISISAITTIIGIIIFAISLVCFEFSSPLIKYLDRTAHSSSIEDAEYNLGLALAYLELNNLIDESDENTIYWYDNLKSSYDNLKNIDDESDIDSSIILTHLNNILDDDDGIRIPSGIDDYSLMTKISGMLVLISFILLSIVTILGPILGIID